MAAAKFDSKNLEIKTKSIEQTLVPLVTQITTLVNHREKPKKSEKTCKAVLEVGKAVNIAVNRFTAVGKAIANDNPDIKDEMVDACKEATTAGQNIAKLTNIQYDDSGQPMNFTEKSSMVRAARGLLSAVTKVLLLADRVVVKQLLKAKDKVDSSLSKLEYVSNFTDFVQAFSQFGSEMVELAHLTGDRQNDLKDEKHRAKMGAARAVLEKSTMMLLTSCKTSLRHPDCESAKENRDGVFSQMRRALAMIQSIVTDEYPSSLNGPASHLIMHNILKDFTDLVESSRVTQVDSSSRDKLVRALHNIIDTTQDFTDSAYTSHEHREKILSYCDKAKMELHNLAKLGVAIEKNDCRHPTEDLEKSIIKMCRITLDLKKQVQDTALDQASEIFQNNEDHDILGMLKNSGVAGDVDKVEGYSVKFIEHSEQLQEACRLLRHISGSAPLQISAEHAENNMKLLGPQTVSAAQTLAINPTSKIAKENLDVFSEAWEQQINDLSVLVKEINDVCQGKSCEKQVYLSLPRPGKHGTTLKSVSVKPVKLDPEEQAKIAKAGLEMKLMTSELDADADKWEDTENDIVKRTKNMSSMAYSMYLFTRGEGPLKTTQDLFTQAEYFAEEGNKLYRTVKDFSFQVPEGSHTIELMSSLEKIPTYCQQLHFTTKSPTTGKIATFTKVDSTINETKNLMAAISRVITNCYYLATTYNLTVANSPIRQWRGPPPPIMNMHMNNDDTESVKSHYSTHSEGSLMRSTALHNKPMTSFGAFERI
uniref:Alpha-catulin-like n=1 Tax=Saccoglossus kowalevskii TaxID=10224 RepID=A0ABM0MFR9_SACKO|nr:PREDICTED: alpha-catulin-like [Saccoglossus kowalevskii]